MNSHYLRPGALILLLVSIYVLFIQYELQLHIFFIRSLQFDHFVYSFVIRYRSGPQIFYLLSLIFLRLSKTVIAEAKVNKIQIGTSILVFPLLILFLKIQQLKVDIFSLADPLTAISIGIIFLKFRLPHVLTTKETAGFVNPDLWLENESSFNWITNTGYINVLNPYQGMLIVGGAGSGKTYSLIEEIIRQAIKKGYTGFIYDYKYPELSNFVYATMTEIKGHKLHYYHLNFSDISRTHRINPIQPANLPVSAFAAEYASVILKNLKKEWVTHADFWADNAIAYLKAIIWYLKKHKPAYCSLPHVISLCMVDYPVILSLLSRDPECKAMVASLITAYNENAGSQVAGCISSLQTPIDKLNNPHIFWVLSGNDCDLDLNNPDHPAILTIGNNPQLAETISPVISLIASVIMKKMNQKNRLKGIFLLDEAPTLYIPDLKNLPNTGRSNKICTVYCCQDFSQMNVLYGADEARALRASLANQFIGLVNDVETAEITSRMFGHRQLEVKSLNASSASSEQSETNYTSGYSIQHQQKNLIEVNEIMTLETGMFIGKTTESKHAFFKGKPIISSKPNSAEVPAFKELLLASKATQADDLNLTTEKLLELNFRKIKNETEELIFDSYRRT